MSLLLVSRKRTGEEILDKLVEILDERDRLRTHVAALREAAQAVIEAAECDGKTIPDGVIACSSGKPLAKTDVRELWLMRAYLKARAALRAMDEAVGS